MSQLPKWLDDNLVTAALGGDLTVKKVRPSKACEDGDNYIGDIYRLVATVETKEGKREEMHFIVKMGAQTSVMQEMLTTWDLLEQEMRILSNVLPNLYEVLEKAAPGKYEYFGAKYFYYGTTPTKFLVLEDLTKEGYEMADRKKGLDMQHCELVLKTLARFHAASVALHKRDPKFIESIIAGQFCKESVKYFVPYCKGGLKGLASMLKECEEPYKTYANAIETIAETFFDDVYNLCLPKEDEFKVLTHSDLWTNNMMFKYSGSDVVGVRFLDYPVCTYGSPAIDLQLFLYTSVNDETLTNNFDELLTIYYSELCEMLDLVGCSSSKITYERFLKEFDKYILYGLFAAGCELPCALREKGDNYDIDASFSSSSENDRSYELYKNKDYVYRIKKILKRFAQKGLFERH